MIDLIESFAEVYDYDVSLLVLFLVVLGFLVVTDVLDSTAMLCPETMLIRTKDIILIIRRHAFALYASLA